MLCHYHKRYASRFQISQVTSVSSKTGIHPSGGRVDQDDAADLIYDGQRTVNDL